MTRGLLLFLTFGALLEPSFSRATVAPAGVFEILVRRPDFAINWHSPRSLLVSMLKEPATEIAGKILNSERLVSMSAYGHVAAHLRCRESSSSAQQDVWFDYTGDSADEGSQLLRQEGAGAALLFHTFSDGELTTDAGDDDGVRAEFHRLSNYKGRLPHVLQFEISSEQCRIASEHLARWIQAPSKRYGFTLDADHYEGAVCTSLPISFLTRMGLYDEAFDTWNRELRISQRWIGRGFPGDDTPATYQNIEHNNVDPTQRYRVSMLDILNLLGPSEWSPRGDQASPLTIVDPKLMWKFIDRAYSCVKGDCKSESIALWVAAHGATAATDQELTGIRLPMQLPAQIARGFPTTSPEQAVHQHCTRCSFDAASAQ